MTYRRPFKLVWLTFRARLQAAWWEARVRAFAPVYLDGRPVAGAWLRAVMHLACLLLPIAFKRS